MDVKREEQVTSLGPLSGVRVVEVGLMHAGPIATGMLGALGAEVIKVEGPESGDPARKLERVYAQDGRFLPGRCTHFEIYNSGKKSLSLDLKHQEGRNLLYKLVAKSDVFLHNMRAETAIALSIDYDSLLRHNPKLVFATISGFGPFGPDSARPGLDPVGMARSGLMVALSGGSRNRPVLPATAASDRMAGIMASYGILAGLYARDHTGQPQRIDASLLGGAMWLGQMNLQYALFKGEELLPAPSNDTPLYTVYQCADGRWITMWVNNNRAWPAFCQAIEMESLLSNPRYGVNKMDKETSHELAAILQKRFAEKSSAEWERILASRSEIVFSLIQLPTEVGSDPQILANGYVVETNHPELGPLKRVALPLHFNGSPIGGFADPSPRLGEDSAEVLSSVLGLDAEEIKRLEAAGITHDARQEKFAQMAHGR